MPLAWQAHTSVFVKQVSEMQTGANCRKKKGHKMICDCSICRAFSLNIPPIAMQFPEGSERRRLAIESPNMPVFWYEEQCPKEAPLTIKRPKKHERIGVDERVLKQYLRSITWRNND